MITQSLLTARQCAVEQLELLEEEDLESDTPNDDLEKLIELQGHAQVASEAPTPFRALSRSSGAHRKRNSVWLNDLLALDNVPEETRRPPSMTRASHGSRFSQLPHLLTKWTDQGEHWTQMHEEPHSTDVLVYGSQNSHRTNSLPRIEQLNTNIQRQDSHDSYNDSPLTTRPPNTIGLSPGPEVTQDIPQTATTTQRNVRLFDSYLADTTRQTSKLSVSMTPPMTPEAFPPKIPVAENTISVKSDSKGAKNWGWRLHDADRAAKRRSTQPLPAPKQ